MSGSGLLRAYRVTTFFMLLYMEYFVKDGWMLNPSEKVVGSITKAIERNGGLCPCYNTSTDPHCPCTDYRENNECHCSLYVIANT